MGRNREIFRQQRAHAELVFRDAQRLYRYLGAGGQLGGVTGDPRLAPGEELIFEERYDVGRFRGADVQYTTPGYFAVGSPAFVLGAMLGNLADRYAARRSAEREAAPQWRFFGPLTCLLTKSSVLFWLDGRWEGDLIAALHDIRPNITFHFVDVCYGSEPIRLVGPTAPWLSVALLHLKYGVAGLHHPALRALAGP
ncbi:hypothetical protein ABZ805_08715 [Saccharopolyspora sp. NPDC047091]|uniref:hypothetical protein n=1 Tax=Saccharopolyspora sp. NPDC047091 TaxID=3155924 RepID=UPI0033EA6CDA